jgi:tetratricopeptide (TPR) repeat protein
LRHLYIAEDFINLFFTKYPMGFSTQIELTPSLEVGLQIIAKTLYRAQEHTPDVVDIWHLLGRFGIWLNEESTTEAAFAKAYTIAPFDPWVHADHAFYRWQCGDYQGAWEHHCFFLEEAPDDPLGLLLAGVYCLQRQERTQAIKYWEQLAGCFEELTHDLDRWRDLGRVESIAQLLEVWLEKAPAVLPQEKIAQAIIDALYILQSRVAWEEAPASLRSQMQRWLQQAQRYPPQDAALWVQEARWSRKEGRLKRSREILLEALSFAPKDREVLHLLAQVEAELGFYAASIGRFMRLIELSHNQENYPIDLYKAQLAAILESHAQVLLREGEKAAAEACYDQILETYESSFIPPGLEMPWLHKARFRLQENKKGLALACAHKALAIHPGSVEGNALTAYILAQMERYQEASPYIHRALSHDPDASFALYTKACLYAMTGRREEALNDLERALRYDPSLSPQAREEGLFRRLHALPRFWQALQTPKPD